MKLRRNPVLQLLAVQHAMVTLSPREREHLGLILAELSRQADIMAEHTWKLRKGPMAAYWRAVCTYSKHLARAFGGRVPHGAR